MPRAKVRPEDRKRSTRACIPCRASKIRCDAQVPCKGCKSRGRESACIYQELHSRPSSRQQYPTALISPSRLTSTVLLPSDYNGDASEQGQTDSQLASDEAWPPSPYVTQTQMLVSRKGEKVFIGENAHLSYLNFLRNVFKRYMGPSPFTENEFKHMMLDVDFDDTEYGNLPPLNIETKKTLFQCYLEATSAIIDLFSENEISEYLSADEGRPSNSMCIPKSASNAAAFQLAIAIGALCRGSLPSDQKIADKYFLQAQRAAFEGQLRDPSLGMVRMFLLMAYYMYTACHRNAAFMYLGVASKAASAVGLHRHELLRKMPIEELQFRQKLWMSLCILDRISNTILGRSTASSITGTETNGPTDGYASTTDPIKLALNATYEMCVLLDELERNLVQGNKVKTATAESFLGKLRAWNQKLPAELRHFSAGDVSAAQSNRRLLIGAVHVACVYYFAVILVTRPFLTSHLMLKLHERSGSRSRARKGGPGSKERQQITSLAQACLDSAKYLATMVHQAINAGFLLRNMCLLNSWAFSAGLLLGFSMFADDDANNETERGLQCVRSFEEYLSDQSPLARHYSGILSDLTDAVTSYKLQRIDEKEQKKSKYVDRVFTMELEAGASSVNPAPASSGPNTNSPEQGPSDSLSFIDSMSMSDLSVDATGDVPMLWEDIFADWQPSAPFTNPDWPDSI